MRNLKGADMGKSKEEWAKEQVEKVEQAASKKVVEKQRDKERKEKYKAQGRE